MTTERFATPANYSDPDPGPFGWEIGIEKANVTQRLAVEYADYEQLPIAGLVGEAKGSSDVDPVIFERVIKPKFQFDEGWAFWVSEEIVAKLPGGFMIAQNIGNCVGASHTALLASVICHEVLAEGDAEEPLGEGNLCQPYIPYSYGGGRSVAGIRGRGDGSTCSAQIKFTLEHGFLPCFADGVSDYGGELPQGSSSVGRDFGASDRLWRKHRDDAIEFKLLEAPRCTSADDLVEGVTVKHMPAQICSGQAFKYDRFDAKYGVHLYRPSGSWAHSMQLIAVFKIKGQWFVVIRNQWGRNAHKGSPEIGVPAGCMVITLEVFSRWVRSAHCVFIGETEGLQSNPGFK